MNYTEIDEALRTLLVIPEGDADWETILPSVINDAEGRIYKDMDFLATQEVNTAGSLTIGNRIKSVPTLMIEVESVAIVVSTNTIPLREVSLEFLNAAWTARASTSTPRYWARVDEENIAVAPTPAAANVVEFVGKVRPAALSAANPNTYIATNHPELMIAACMVFSTGYQRDFGAQSDDARSAVSWESVYKERLASTMAEELRRKGLEPGGQ